MVDYLSRESFVGIATGTMIGFYRETRLLKITVLILLILFALGWFGSITSSKMIAFIKSKRNNLYKF